MAQSEQRYTNAHVRDQLAFNAFTYLCVFEIAQVGICPMEIFIIRRKNISASFSGAFNSTYCIDVNRFSMHRSSDEVLHILGNILGALQRGRTSLVIPKKKPIDELMKSRNMVSAYCWWQSQAHSDLQSSRFFFFSLHCRNHYHQIYPMT